MQTDKENAPVLTEEEKKRIKAIKEKMIKEQQIVRKWKILK